MHKPKYNVGDMFISKDKVPGVFKITTIDQDYTETELIYRFIDIRDTISAGFYMYELSIDKHFKSIGSSEMAQILHGKLV